MEGFKDRSFEEVEGGKYDENGFYRTPNGSFWDPSGVYFNRKGIDNHGGKYNEEMEYVPGPNWLEEHLCYADELDDLKSFAESMPEKMDLL